MKETQDGVLPKHPGSGMPHHPLDLFAALALITVDRAFRAGRLVLAKAAPVQADGGIREQSVAFRAKLTRAGMAAPTITADHCRQGFPLAS